MASRLGKRIKDSLSTRQSTREERHQFTVFLLAELTGLIGFPLHIIGVWGSGDMVLQALSIGNWIGLLAIFMLYLYNKEYLHSVFNGYGIVMQLFLSTKIIYISITQPPIASYLILFNSFISMLVIIILVMGYMRTLPVCLTAVSLVTSVAARLIAPGLVQMQFLLFFLFVELFACALGFMIWRDVHEMEKENTDYRNEENKILKTLHMTKDELTAFLAMSLSDDHDPKYVRSIFDSLDERSEHNILKAVREHESEIRMEKVDIAKAFPMLSATEQDVCRLVLKGKTLSEIANQLGKTSNNISAVRIHIRKKLGLQSGQDLRQFLDERIK